MRLASLLAALALAAGCGAGAAGVDAAAETSVDADGDATTDADAGPELPEPVAGTLAAWCEDEVGAPVVEELAPGLFVARGFDLAHTILLTTPDGNVVIDAGMSPTRSTVTREALMAVAPGPTRALIYTHGHIDHTGGASVWVDEGTEIWATERLLDNVIRQYGALRPAESARGELQFGQHVDEGELPCSSIGRRPDVEAALATGLRRPTHTFEGQASFEVGGVTVELVEAHGETDDQLFVWLPHLETLLPGDNFYRAFPNLYTVRGTRPRPVDAWIGSLDAMRRKAPALLVPSHTRPVVGREEVQQALTEYRDAIQWVRDAVVRGANTLTPVETLVRQTRLPSALADSPYLRELYGQVDWSVRALYGGELGWFDGRTHALYPPDDLVAREVALMGGAEAVLAQARAALDGEPRWAMHLLGKLVDAGLRTEAQLSADLAAAYRAVAAGVDNSNGKGWLLEAALRLESPPAPPAPVTLDPIFVAELPVGVLFEVLPSLLKTDLAADVHQTLWIDLVDVQTRYVLTVRNGVAEIVTGEPLPGTPDPVAVLTTDTLTWKQLGLGVLDPLAALGEGLIASDDLFAVLSFLELFESGL